MTRRKARRECRARLSLLLGFVVLALVIGSADVRAEEGLAGCAAAFSGDDVAEAPHRINPTAATQAESVPLCYRLGGNVFFAVGYNTKRLMPDWVAHKLEDSFGTDGCGSIPRDDLGCYFGEDDVAACIATKKDTDDPFHADETLKRLGKPRLPVTAFSLTGHDRGHLAPNQSFSWHVCGAYQTFTMANMAPQLAKLNRELWADLERQVLFWAVTEGPLYVVSGTMFKTFPAAKFKIIKSGGVDKQTIVKPNQKLKPSAAGLPGQVVKPTGFYKVILRPARDGEPARAVGFLVPHTRTPMNANYRNFIARVDVVEAASGFAFSVPAALKGAGGQEWWLERLVPKSWVLRAKTCPADGPREGWEPDLSREDRLSACAEPD